MRYYLKKVVNIRIFLSLAPLPNYEWGAGRSTNFCLDRSEWASPRRSFLERVVFVVEFDVIGLCFEALIDRFIDEEDEGFDL